MKTLLALSLILTCTAGLCQEVEIGDELLPNGNFETPNAAGDRPASWNWQGGVVWQAENGNHWVVEEAKTPASLSISQTLPMQERFWKIRVSCRVRYTAVVQGAESWHNGRLAMQFQDDAGQMVGAWSNVLYFVGTSTGWETASRDYIVPPGARKLSLSCSLFSTTGKMEWDDVSVKLIAFDPVVEDARLPEGVRACWDLESAWREESPTRGRVCINGLWRFHPVDLKQTELPGPGTGWGYYKVPMSWAPGTAAVKPLGPDIWEERMDLNKVDAAWYQREITIPPGWAGRRILVNLDNPKHFARVLVDGQEAGRIDWPGGRLDITPLVTPGRTHLLSIHVNALPIDPEQILIAREDLIQTARAEVRYKGLCGDCYLESEPAGPRIEDVFLKPSVSRGGLGVACEASGLQAGRQYRLRVSVYEGSRPAPDAPAVRSFTSDAFAGPTCPEFFGPWADAKLWDIDQPNLYCAQVELLDDTGAVLDRTLPVPFGFREFRIQGREFLLNGKPIHLRCLDYSNHTRFATADYASARETFRRARAMGFNYVIHSNYDYDAQDFAYITDTVRAGDEAGFPMSFSIRHIKRDVANMSDPAKRANWERIVQYEVRQMRNHPSVFMWAMDHNMLGWADDQNPGQLTGTFEPTAQDNPGLARNRAAATIAESIVMGLDSTRPAYHHQSGSFNQMITLNCYLCFTPYQERIEWLSKWATEGVKPLFFVEFGLPHQASWGGHRTGPFVWRNNVSSEPLVEEFGAMFYGDAAYDLPKTSQDQYDTIERVYLRKQPFHISSVLGAYWDRRIEKNFLEVKTLHTLLTWPAFRTWGISAILPWDQADLFKQISNLSSSDTQRRPLPTDWTALQRPGISPEWRDWTNDWLTCPDDKLLERTSLGQAFAKVNRETLAYIAGPRRRFTAQDHLFAPGEAVEKQAGLINDLRRDVVFRFTWKASVNGEILAQGEGGQRVAAGNKALVPFTFTVPTIAPHGAAGRIDMVATVDGRTDETLQSSFDFTVVAPAPPLQQTARVALWDPEGLSAAALEKAGLRFQRVDGPVPPPDCQLFIIGREAITLDGPGIDIQGMCHRGLTVLILEQTEDVLQRRLGFRTASPGTRRVFLRRPDNPACAGLTNDMLRDWRGSSSLLEAYPAPWGYRGNYPEQVWCGFGNSRTWQWGNYGCVADVVVEKPQTGNFSSLLDCEFDLQYTPLLEYTSQPGRVILSQIDFSGRDLDDPAQERLLNNLLSYAQLSPATIAGAWVPRTSLSVRYVGSAALRDLIASLGAHLSDEGKLAVIGPDADPAVARAATAAAERILCIGLDGKALTDILGVPFTTREERRIISPIGYPPGAFAGLGNADFHWRAKTAVQVITSAPNRFRLIGDGLLAQGTIDGRDVAIMQSHPLLFNYEDEAQLRRTWRNAVRALGVVLTNCDAKLDCVFESRFGSGGPVALSLAGPWRIVADPGKRFTAEQIFALADDDPAWKPLTMPGTFESQVPALASYDGIVWLRKEFDLPQVPTAPGLTLRVGAVDDEDWTYLNGTLVGHIGQDTNPDDYWSADRSYPVPPGLLRPGRNVLVVKVNDLRQTGGITKLPLGIYEPGRWLNGYYLDVPVALDDPYRYNRW